MDTIRQNVIERLEQVNFLKVRLCSLKLELANAQQDAASVRAISYSEPISKRSGAARPTENTATSLADLDSKITSIQMELLLLDDCLSLLSDVERTVITLSYLNTHKVPMSQIAAEIDFSPAQTYRIRNVALDKLCAMLG